MAWLLFDAAGILLLIWFFFGVDAALRTALVFVFLLNLALAAFFVFLAWFIMDWWLAAPMVVLQGAILFKTWCWDWFCDLVERRASR